MAGTLADPRKAPPAKRKRDSGSLPPLVLVVEDHEDTRLLLRTVLELRGCRVEEAGDGEEGVRLARERRPRLILMDATLPVLDGLAATRRIRSDSEMEGVPIIFLSGHGQPDFRAAALDAGGTEFLLKPVALDDLASVLERRLCAA